MDRREELIKLTNDPTLIPLIDKMLFLEEQLDTLEKLPMIKINPKNPTQMKTTPAAKLFKEFLQQYSNIIKIIEKTTGDNESEEDSPLRKWVKSRNDLDA